MEEVISLHASVLGVPLAKAEHYVQSRDRLVSAMSRPANAAFYEAADIHRQAATLLWGLVESHGFLDGNKRVAWVATRVFLAINGYTLDATVDERVDLVIGVAVHEVAVADAESWIRQHVAPAGQRRRLRR